MWPAVAALLTAPQFRNALLNLIFFHFRPMNTIHHAYIIKQYMKKIKKGK